MVIFPTFQLTCHGARAEIALNMLSFFNKRILRYDYQD